MHLILPLVFFFAHILQKSWKSLISFITSNHFS